MHICLSFDTGELWPGQEGIRHLCPGSERDGLMTSSWGHMWYRAIGNDLCGRPKCSNKKRTTVSRFSAHAGWDIGSHWLFAPSNRVFQKESIGVSVQDHYCLFFVFGNLSSCGWGTKELSFELMNRDRRSLTLKNIASQKVFIQTSLSWRSFSWRSREFTSNSNSSELRFRQCLVTKTCDYTNYSYWLVQMVRCDMGHLVNMISAWNHAAWLKKPSQCHNFSIVMNGHKAESPSNDLPRLSHVFMIAEDMAHKSTTLNRCQFIMLVNDNTFCL